MLLTVLVCVGVVVADSMLVRKQKCCLVEAVAWQEARVCRLAGSGAVVGRGAVLLVNGSGETGNNSADSLLVGEQKCCLVEAVAWQEARVKINCIFNPCDLCVNALNVIEMFLLE